MKRIKIFNGNIITPYRTITDGMIIIENGIIQEVSESPVEITDAETIDANGAWIAPGFIDLHTHGAGNYDFMDGTVEAYLQAARMHATHGTTLLFPTTLTSTKELLFESFDIYRKAKVLNREGAAFGGLHLEGPYFAMSQRR